MTDPTLEEDPPDPTSADLSVALGSDDDYIEISDAVAEKPSFMTTVTLEEQIEPLKTEPVPMLSAGDQVSWGEMAWTVATALPDGWFNATSSNGTPVAVHPGRQKHWGILEQVPTASALLRFAGPEGIVLETTATPVTGPMGTSKLLSSVGQLAQVIATLADLGYAVVDLDPRGIVVTDTGLALTRWPALAAVGEPLPQRYREGISPPELAHGGRASGKEGVYLLGAIMALWVRGEPLGPEGMYAIPEQVKYLPGVPQFLTGCLGPAAIRPEPAALSDLLDFASPAPVPEIRVGAATTIGCNLDRHRNEDSFGVRSEWMGGATGSSLVIRAAVSDGMGGMDAGDEASKAAIDAFLSDLVPDTLEDDAMADWAISLGWSANDAVIAQLDGRNGGATLTGLVFDGARYALVHVGDSRAYLWSRPGASARNADPRYRDVGTEVANTDLSNSDRTKAGNGPAGTATEPRLRMLSQDHTLVAAMVASGIMTAAEAAESPDRNQLLRSLGSAKGRRDGFFAEIRTSPSARTETLDVGAVIALMSDGVWDLIDETAIQEMLATCGDDPQRVAQFLVDAAVVGGAPDNATAVVICRTR